MKESETQEIGFKGPKSQPPAGDGVEDRETAQSNSLLQNFPVVLPPYVQLGN